jgi:hypothetical protein
MPRRKNRSRNILRPVTPSGDDSDGDGGGWSVIPGRCRGTLHLSTPALSSSSSPSPSAHSKEDLEVALNRAQRILHGHPLLQPLHGALLKGAGAAEILVLGLGSLHSATAPSSMLQLAMVLSLPPLLAVQAPPSPIRFVDPVFTPADLAVLSRFGVATAATERETLENGNRRAGGGGRGEEILLAPHLDFSVLHGYLARCAERETMPSVILSNDVRRFLELLVFPTPHHARADGKQTYRRRIRVEGFPAVDAGSGRVRGDVCCRRWREGEGAR